MKKLIVGAIVALSITQGFCQQNQPDQEGSELLNNASNYSEFADSIHSAFIKFFTDNYEEGKMFEYNKPFTGENFKALLKNSFGIISKLRNENEMMKAQINNLNKRLEGLEDMVHTMRRK